MHAGKMVQRLNRDTHNFHMQCIRASLGSWDTCGCLRISWREVRRNHRRASLPLPHEDADARRRRRRLPWPGRSRLHRQQRRPAPAAGRAQTGRGQPQTSADRDVPPPAAAGHPDPQLGVPGAGWGCGRRAERLNAAFPAGTTSPKSCGSDASRDERCGMPGRHWMCVTGAWLRRIPRSDSRVAHRSRRSSRRCCDSDDHCRRPRRSRSSRTRGMGRKNARSVFRGRPRSSTGVRSTCPCETCLDVDLRIVHESAAHEMAAVADGSHRCDAERAPAGRSVCPRWLPPG